MRGRIWGYLNSAFGNLPSARAISIIVALSIVVKVGYITLLGGGWNSFPTEGTDGTFYHTAALNWVTTEVYSVVPGIPTVAMPPGEPAFLAALYLVSNSSMAFAKLAHVVLLTLAAVTTYLTGKRLISPAAGFWSGALIAVDPAQAYLSGTFLSEPLFILLMMLGIYLLVRPSLLSPGWLIGAGICFGLAGLARNQGWLFSLTLLPGSVILGSRLIRLRYALVVLLATCMTILPWTIRNFTVTGRFIPVSSEGGLTLWASNNPEFVVRPPMPMSLPIYTHPAGLDGDELDNYYRSRAVDWILANPGQFALNGLSKFYALFSFDPLSWRQEKAELYRLAGLVPYGILLPFILIGTLWRLNDRRFAVLYWYILFTIGMAILFYGDSRIRAPIQPYLYIFGVLGIRDILRRWRGRVEVVKGFVENRI